MLNRHTVKFESPPDTLWELLTEPDQIKKWNPSIVSDEPKTPGPPRVGSVSAMRIKEGSRIVDYESEVTIFDENTHLEILLKGGSLGKSPMRISYRLDSTPSPTTLHYTAEWQPVELSLRLLSPLFRLMGGRHLNQAMTRLKALAESETIPDSAQGGPLES